MCTIRFCRCRSASLAIQMNSTISVNFHARLNTELHVLTHAPHCSAYHDEVSREPARSKCKVMRLARVQTWLQHVQLSGDDSYTRMPRDRINPFLGIQRRAQWLVTLRKYTVVVIIAICDRPMSSCFCLGRSTFQKRNRLRYV